VASPELACFFSADGPAARQAVQRVSRLPSARRSKRIDRWIEFQKEYGLDRQQRQHQVSLAKYGIDTILFTVDGIVDSVEDVFEWENRGGSWQPASQVRVPHPQLERRHRPAFLEDARVEIDIDVRRIKPRITLQFVVPFGG
jgi:hypothetical protein